MRTQASAGKAANAIPEERILDAAYDLALSIGIPRMTMAEVARRAKVSRATLYRRWSSVRELVATLSTREWTSVVDAASVPVDDTPLRGQLVATVVRLVGEIRVHPLLRTIIALDPEFLLPYLLHRRGGNTEQQLAMLETAIAAGHADGSIRAGDPAVLAQSVLLTGWSFALTGPVLTGSADGPGIAALDAELALLLDRFLAP